ncbi:hypothetical protein BGZ76_006234, partial [Entomortierella beljakovae]
HDGFKCLAWITSLHCFFTGAKIPDDQCTLHAVIFLTGSATLWWEGQHLQDTASFDEFESAFKTEYCPAGFEDHVHSLLFSIQMETTVTDFIARLHKYISILCPPMMNNEARLVLEQTAKTCFLNGTPDTLRQILTSLDIASGSSKSVYDLCNAAKQFDSIYNFSVSAPSSSTQHNQSVISSHTANQVDPMAMEIDSLCVQLNAIQRQMRYQNTYKTCFPNNYSPHLDDSERTRLYQRGACFHCRHDGHQARDCPNRGHSFNNLKVVHFANHERPSLVQDLAAEVSSLSSLDKGSVLNPELSYKKSSPNKNVLNNSTTVPVLTPQSKFKLFHHKFNSDLNIKKSTSVPIPTPSPSVPVLIEMVDLDLPSPSNSLVQPFLLKSKIKHQKKHEIRLHTFSPSMAERTLLKFIGSVNGQPAQILIDGGAEGNVISSSFQKQHSILVNSCSPIPIVLPNRSTTITTLTASILLQRDNYSDNLDAIVYPLQKYNLILGKPWLTQINPQINWRTNGLHFTHDGCNKPSLVLQD